MNDAPKHKVEIIIETAAERAARLDAIQREYDYRRAEAEGLGRNPERAQAEANAWKAQFKPITKDK